MGRDRLNILPQIFDLGLFYFSLHSQTFALLLLNEVYAMMNTPRIHFYQSRELNFQIWQSPCRKQNTKWFIRNKITDIYSKYNISTHNQHQLLTYLYCISMHTFWNASYKLFSWTYWVSKSILVPFNPKSLIFPWRLAAFRIWRKPWSTNWTFDRSNWSLLPSRKTLPVIETLIDYKHNTRIP